MELGFAPARHFMTLRSIALVYILLQVGLGQLISGDASPEVIEQTIDWKSEKQGRFPVCAYQAPVGDVWVGTEDDGLWRLTAAGGGQRTWVQYKESNGLGENHLYAISSDRLNRIWVGHASRGVWVFNGSEWKNYDVPRGPIGERIYDIKADVTKNRMWIATNAGVSVYDIETDSWTHLELPEANSTNPVTALVVDDRNGVYLGFETAGLLYCANPSISKKSTWTVPEVARYLAGRSTATGAIFLALRLGVQTPELTRILNPDIEKELSGNVLTIPSRALLVRAFRDQDEATSFFSSLFPGRDLTSITSEISKEFRNKDKP